MPLLGDARRKHPRSRCPSIRFLRKRSLSGETAVAIAMGTTGCSPMSIIADVIRIGVKRFSEQLSDLLRKESGSRNGLAGIPSGTPTRHFYEALARSSKSCRVDAPFFPAIHDRHLYSSGHAGKARRTAAVLSLLFPAEPHKVRSRSKKATHRRTAA